MNAQVQVFYNSEVYKMVKFVITVFTLPKLNDMLQHIFTFLFSLHFSVKGQGLLPNGDPYFCVPPGICPYSGGIDPRIMTPVDNEVKENLTNTERLIQQVFFNRALTSAGNYPGLVTCPTGRIPCYAQGSMSNCGMRLVRIPNPSPDGEAPYGAYPWQAYLVGPRGNFIGSGSLISPYHVLTATHKILQYANNASQLTVIMGVNDPAKINASNPRSMAAQIFIFNASTYNNLTLKNDIAIVRLATPISLLGTTSVNTICLPLATSNGTTYMRPQRCLVSGWGQTQPSLGAVPTKLKHVALTTTDINTCTRAFTGIVDTAMYLDQTGGELCAGGEAQKDACFQDGGAPLTCGAGTTASRYTVAGIVIWGKSCGQPGVYGVYTNVPTYRAWIIRTITQKIT